MDGIFRKVGFGHFDVVVRVSNDRYGMRLSQGRKILENLHAGKVVFKIIRMGLDVITGTAKTYSRTDATSNTVRIQGDFTLLGIDKITVDRNGIWSKWNVLCLEEIGR